MTGLTDFNDLAKERGAEAIRQAIGDALPADEPDRPEVPVDTEADSAERPQAVSDFYVTTSGVYHAERDKEGLAKEPSWICSPLFVTAKVRSGRGENWGRLLEWNDPDGNRHSWAMPMEMLAGDGSAVREELMRRGLEIAPGLRARSLFATYLLSARTDERATCTERTGWHGGAYVLPDATIGTATDRVVFQHEGGMELYHAEAGTLDDWQRAVAALCMGNSRLAFAVSTTFAGPLLWLAGLDGGGFNLVGGTSCGKSTALAAAASVYGPPLAVRSWRATGNGLEGVAQAHNDATLILDELGQVDAREAGEVAYLLANGSGKQRAGRGGNARRIARWRVLLLSAGEVGLSQHMADGSKRARAGQEVRLCDIPADAGAGLGAFETLHGHRDGAALSSAIKRAAAEAFGTAWRPWLHYLAGNLRDLPSTIRDGLAQFRSACLLPGSGGQVARALDRFALVGVAGELATRAGLTGWPQDTASTAAEVCFLAWLGRRGGPGNAETAALVAQVRAFFEAHGESRFTALDGFENPASDRATINRAGFARYRSGAREYLVLGETFRRDICAGFDPKAAARLLAGAGMVLPDAEGKSTQRVRLPGLGSVRVYVMPADRIHGGEE